MIAPKFCNYNIDYQQRLGFLKLLVLACDGIRGSRDAYRERMRKVFERKTLPGSEIALDINALIDDPRLPSRQIGFSPERLDRLVLWAEMTGLIASNGRLSEWARILNFLSLEEIKNPRFNPFLLSSEQVAFFVHLLFYSDQVLPLLVRQLSKCSVGVRIPVRQACLEIVESLGQFLDGVSPTGAERIRIRQEARDLLQRTAAQYGLRDRNSFLAPERRNEALSQLRGLPKLPRVHLAEYHAICRFEQLTDLGLLTKEEPGKKRTGASDSKKLWEWYPTAQLGAAAAELSDFDVETFLTSHWIGFCQAASGKTLQEARSLEHQVQIAKLLDENLLASRRQLGPIQVHTWAVLTSLQALSEGTRLELGTTYGLLDAIRQDAAAGDLVRQGGKTTFLGRTASVSHGSIAEHLKRQPVTEALNK